MVGKLLSKYRRGGESMSLKKLVEAKIGQVGKQEFDFALENLRLEIVHKFKRIPNALEMRQVVICNIEFYRENRKLMEG